MPPSSKSTDAQHTPVLLELRVVGSDGRVRRCRVSLRDAFAIGRAAYECGGRVGMPEGDDDLMMANTGKAIVLPAYETCGLVDVQIVEGPELVASGTKKQPPFPLHECERERWRRTTKGP